MPKDIDVAVLGASGFTGALCTDALQLLRVVQRRRRGRATQPTPSTDSTVDLQLTLSLAIAPC